MNTNIQNMLKDLTPNKYKNLKQYRLIIISFIISASIFYLFQFLEKYLYRIYLVDYYLAIHTITEFTTIIMYIASFLVIYYVDKRDKRLRMKLLAATLLFVGCVDFWHTFSYDGMPGLLVPSTAQSATAYWIIGRIGLAGGVLISSFIPLQIKVEKIKRSRILFLPFALSILILIYISYFPNGFPLLIEEGRGLTPIKHVFEYIIILMLFISMINYIREYNKTKDSIIPVFISALIISIFSELSFVNYFSVYDTYNLLGHIYKLIASYMIFKVLFIVNIKHPYSRLDKAEREISRYANNLEQLVARRTDEIDQANQDLIRDLEYAKTIQKAIMSVKHEEYGDLEVYSEYIPYEKVGGDFYDFDELNDEYLAFYIGDVAGHGVPAAMMTIFMNQTIIKEKVYQSGHKEIYSPNEVLTNLYKEYNKTDFPLEMYAVMLYGLYNKKNNKLLISSAGLNTYPIIYKENGEVELIKHTGFPICKFDKYYQPDFKNYSIDLNKGSKILFYTDGVVETSNRNSDIFGEERLINIIKEKGHLSPKDLSQEINNEINNFIKGVKLNDDTHYFIIEVK